jgi:hypothetical protein
MKMKESKLYLQGKDYHQKDSVEQIKEANNESAVKKKFLPPALQKVTPQLSKVTRKILETLSIHKIIEKFVILKKLNFIPLVTLKTFEKNTTFIFKLRNLEYERVIHLL